MGKMEKGKSIMSKVTMEKPRKNEHATNCPLFHGHLCNCVLSKWEKICSTHGDYACACGADKVNNTIDAMSTWLVGQVPTEEQTELEIHRYFDKGLKSDKPTNITIEFLARHLHERLIRKLTGEV